MKGVLRTPVAAAVVGGLVVAIAFLVFGIGDSTKKTTVVQQAPISEPAANSDQGLTANAIYKRDAPGVVFIRSQIVRRVDSVFGLPEEQRGEATGSGFVIDDKGYILTNWHVIAGASKVTVSFENDKTVEAKVVGRDPSDDLALLKVNPDGLTLDPLTLGDSKSVQVGDPVLALGNPFNLDRTLTQGIVSALQRQISAPNGFGIDNVIQTDAAINPGNSGGPLLDAAGRVIGINSQIATGNGNSSETGGSVGIGFAVPINTAKRVIPQLKESGKVQRAYLGVTGVTIDASLAKLNLKAAHGVLVQEVTPGGPAAKAGIRGGDSQATIDGNDVVLGGDVITRIDGRPVHNMDDVVGAVNAKKPGQKVAVGILRDGKPQSVTVDLAQRPNQAPSQ
jgi:S1-C subfamily serine protease